MRVRGSGSSEPGRFGPGGVVGNSRCDRFGIRMGGGIRSSPAGGSRRGSSREGRGRNSSGDGNHSSCGNGGRIPSAGFRC